MSELPSDPNWSNLTWHPEAAEVADSYHFGSETIMSVLHNPQRAYLAPESADKGYPVARFIRGDVMIVVGFARGPEQPYVMALYRLTDEAMARKTRQPRTNAGSGSGSNDPKSWLDLNKRIVAMGYRIEPGNHPKVVTKDGIFVYSLPGTASDFRALPNAWHNFLNAAEYIPATA